MSKLFEVVNKDGSKTTLHADRITHVSSVLRGTYDALCIAYVGTEDCYVNVPYDEFVQLWRKALGEDVRTDEQRMRDLEALESATMNQYAAQQNLHLYQHGPQCNCMACSPRRALGL